MHVCLVTFWPGCLRGWLCQSPVVWPGRTTLHFPSFLVSEFLGAAVTEALGTRTCCGISHRAVIQMGTELSLGSGCGCRRGEGGGQRSTPCTYNKYPADKLLWAQRGVICTQWLGLGELGKRWSPTEGVGGSEEGRAGSAPMPLLTGAHAALAGMQGRRITS